MSELCPTVPLEWQHIEWIRAEVCAIRRRITRLDAMLAKADAANALQIKRRLHIELTMAVALEGVADAVRAAAAAPPPPPTPPGPPFIV